MVSRFKVKYLSNIDFPFYQKQSKLVYVFEILITHGIGKADRILTTINGHLSHIYSVTDSYVMTVIAKLSQ